MRAPLLSVPMRQRTMCYPLAGFVLAKAEHSAPAQAVQTRVHAAQCRWDKNYSACYLDDMPHKRLTRPVRVFEWFFDGMRKGHGRENILRLEVRVRRCICACAEPIPWSLHNHHLRASGISMEHMERVLIGLMPGMSCR